MSLHLFQFKLEVRLIGSQHSLNGCKYGTIVGMHPLGHPGLLALPHSIDLSPIIPSVWGFIKGIRPVRILKEPVVQLDYSNLGGPHTGEGVANSIAVAGTATNVLPEQTCGTSEMSLAAAHSADTWQS